MLRRLQSIASAAIAAALTLAVLPARGDDGVSLVEVNGVRFAVAERALRGEPERVARELEARWRRETPTAWIGWASVGERRLVARRRGPLQETASFRPATNRPGSRVVISVLDTRSSPSGVPQAPVELPPASRWLSSVRTLSAAPETTVEWLALTDGPVAAARRAWLATLRRTGWRALMQPGAFEGLYEREGQTVWLNLRPVGARTSVVLQWRRGSTP